MRAVAGAILRCMDWHHTLLAIALCGALAGGCGEPDTPDMPGPPGPAEQAPVTAARLQPVPLLPATTAAPRHEPWWRQRHARVKRDLRANPPELLFIGDSIMQGWEGRGRRVWEQFWGARRMGNLGFSGDRTEHVLWRLERGELEGLAPRLVVLMIGTNNTERDVPPDTVEGVVAILRLLRERLPDSRILLLAIFPRGADAQDPERLMNDAVNRELERRAPLEGALYRDLSDLFLDARGVLSPALMPDLLHPNAEGYRLWAEALEPQLAELLSAPARSSAPR